MPENERPDGTQFTVPPLAGSVSRKQLLKAAAAGTVVAAMPATAAASGGGTWSFPFFPQITSGRYSTEQIGTILDALATPHYLAATGATTTLANASAVGLTGWQLSMQQAAAAREQYHIDFLTSLGAVPATTSFTFPPGLFSNRAQVLAVGEGASTILIAAHMTAAREFAELGEPLLAKWMYQIGAIDAEQRAIFRTMQAMDGVASAVPPNNKAFETDLFLYTADAVGVLRKLGLIGGPGSAVSYPGREAVLAAAGPMAAAILQQKPNNAASTVAVTGPAGLIGQRA